MILSGGSDMTPEDWNVVNDRIGEAANFARAATTNAVTALTSLTVAIVGVVITVSLGEIQLNSLKRSLLFLMCGALAAAFIMLICLTFEARRAMIHAGALHDIYDKALMGNSISKEKLRLELQFSRYSVSFFYKISLPMACLFLGIAACMASLAISFLFK